MNLIRRDRLIPLASLIVPALVVGACGTSPGVSVVSTTGAAVSASDSVSDAESVALSRILVIEDHRLLGDAELKAYLASSDAIIAAAAATAVGRIGDPSLEPELITLLGASEGRVRSAAALGLELVGGSTAEAPLLARLAVEPEISVRNAIFDAIGHVGTAASMPAVTAAITGNVTSSEKGAAAEALAILVEDGVAAPGGAQLFQELVQLAGDRPEESAAPAAFALRTLGAAGAPYEAAIQTASQTSPYADARASLADALSTIGTPTAFEAIATMAANDPVDRVRAEAAGDLAAGGATPAILSALSKALGDPSSAVVVAAATATESLGAGAASLVPQLQTLYDGGAIAIQTAVLGALVAANPTVAAPLVEAALSAPLPLALVAVSALGTLNTSEGLDSLTNLILDPDPRLASQAMGTLSSLPAASITPAMKTNARKALDESTNFEVIDGVSWVAGSFGWTDFAAGLAAVYAKEGGDPNMNARINILWALGNIGSAADLPTIKLGLKDDQRLVALQAAASYQQLTGVNVSSEVPLESIVHATTPSYDEVESAIHSLVVLETNRGVITIQMLSATPLNAVNFVKLVESGFYNGLTFPRVIPNFIAQGGDPLGDGFGTSKQFVRDEFSQIPHLQGAVGLATEGKDTGSCQFFINLTWNEQLDGNYTVFGEVVSDLSTTDTLEVGDTIRDAYVVSAK